MTLPTTPQEAYDYLASDTVLGALLGTYTFGNGDFRPAMVCLFPGERLPDGLALAGVEVAISREPQRDGAAFITGGGYWGQTIRLYVTQWEPGEGEALNYAAAVNRVLSLLPGASSVPVELPEGLGGLAQTAVAWNPPVGAMDLETVEPVLAP